MVASIRKIRLLLCLSKSSCLCSFTTRLVPSAWILSKQRISKIHSMKLDRLIILNFNTLIHLKELCALQTSCPFRLTICNSCLCSHHAIRTRFLINWNTHCGGLEMAQTRNCTFSCFVHVVDSWFIQMSIKSIFSVRLVRVMPFYPLFLLLSNPCAPFEIRKWLELAMESTSYSYIDSFSYYTISNISERIRSGWSLFLIPHSTYFHERFDNPLISHGNENSIMANYLYFIIGFSIHSSPILWSIWHLLSC